MIPVVGWIGVRYRGCDLLTGAVDVCEPKLACTSGVPEFVMSLAVEPKYGELLVLAVVVEGV